MTPRNYTPTAAALPPRDTPVEAITPNGHIVTLEWWGRYWWSPARRDWVWWVPVFWKPITEKDS